MTEFFKPARDAMFESRSRGQTAIAPPSSGLENPGNTSEPQVDPVAATTEAFFNRRRAIGMPEAIPDAGAPPEQVDPVNAITEAFFKRRPEFNTAPPAPENAPNKDANFLTDIGNSLGIGFNNLALNARELIGYVGGEKVVKALDSIDQWMSGKTSEEIIKGNIKEAQARLSQEAQAASEKKWWDSDKNTFGSAWSDPRSYINGIAQSLPEEAVTMFPAMKLAKAVYAGRMASAGATRIAASTAAKEAAVAEGATAIAAERAGMLAGEEAVKQLAVQSSAAAARAAAVTGGISEGLFAGAGSSREVRDKIMAMTPAQLEQSEAFKALLADGTMTPEQARITLANDAAAQAFVTSAAVTGAFSGLGDRMLAKIITDGATKGVIKRGFKGAVTEGVLEEFPQEYGSAVMENLAMRKADPNVELTHDALNSAFGGMATGMVQGGGMAAVMGRSAPSESKTVTDTDKNVTVRYNTEDTSPAADMSQFKLPEEAVAAVVDSPAYMAAAWNMADDAGRAQLAKFAPDVDFETLAADRDLVREGTSMIREYPQFYSMFTAQVGSNESAPVQNAQAADVPFEPTDVADNPAPRFYPDRANMSVAQGLSDQGIQEAEGNLSRNKPIPSNEDQTLVSGPESTDVEAGNPESAVLLEGYSREARNIEGTQDPARRRYLANQAMTSMIRNGFTFDDANAMFGQFINQDQATIEAAPAPQETVGERLQTFNKIRKGLVDHDNKTWGVASTEADYQVANLTPAIYKLADLFGVKVVGFKYTGKDTKLARRRGVSSPDGIAINVSSRDQMMTIFGHEVYHQLSKRDKKASKELEQRVLAYISEDGQQALRTRLENIGYSPEKINEETVADIMGVMFQDPRFWQQLGEEKPSLLQKVLRVIDDMIKRFGQLGSRSEEIASYINEMDAVRDMMADFVSQSLDKQANVQEIEDSVEMSDDPIGQFQELAKAGRKVAAAKIFREAGFYNEYGVPFEQFYKDALVEKPAPVVEPVKAEAPIAAPVETPAAPVEQPTSTLSSVAKDEITRMYQERAASTAQMNAYDQTNALTKFAKDLQEYGFSEAEIGSILTGETEVIDPKTLESKKVKFGYSPASKNVGSTTRQSANKNVTEGTLEVAPPQEPTDAGTAGNKQQRMAERKARVAESRKTYSDGVARAVINQQLDPKGDSIVNPKLEYEFRVGDQVVGKVFSAGDQYFRFNIKQDGSYNYGVGSNLGGMIAKPPAGATIRRINDIPRQTSMDLEGNKQQVNKYTAEVKRIMTTAFTPSRVGDTLAEMRAALDEQFANPFFKNGKDRSDVEYIFNMFADVGAISADDVKSRNEEVDAIRKAIEQLQAKDTSSRAGLLKVHAAKISAALDDLSRTMAEDGMSQQQINEIVGPAQESLQVIEDATDAAEVFKETGTEGRQIDENTLDLPSKDFSEARQAAAAAVDEIVNGKQSPIAVIRRELNKPDRAFTFSDLRKEMAARGMDISEIDREVAQWPAAQYSLAYWVQKNQGLMSPYMARTAWFNSHENIMAIYKDEPALRGQYEAELSDVEKRFIEAMRKDRQAVRDRRTQTLDEFGEESADPKDAFPNALFNKYSLNDMRNLEESNISEDEQAILRSLVGGNPTFLPRLWLDDVAFAIDARKDLRLEILEGLSKQERAAVEKYLELSASALANNERISALRTYSTMLDEIGNLDKAAYDAFKAQIIYSDLKAIPAILHRAQVIAAEAAQAKDKKQLGAILSAYLDRVYHEDEMAATSLEEGQPEFDAIRGGGRPEITEREIDQYVAMMERQGALIDRDTAKNDLLYQAIAEISDTEGQRTFETPEESAASAVDQPENQVGLSGDIRYKRGRFSHGPAAATVQAHIAEITQNWKRKPNIQVLFNVDQITDPDLRDRLTSRAESGAFKGAIDPDTGAVYIFSQHLTDLADAEFVMFHELYGHYGLRAFLGDKLNAFLENQYKLNKQVKEEADRQFQDALDSGSPMSRIESIEEAISDMAANGKPSLFRQLVGQLVAWMRKHGMDNVANWIDSTGTSELAYVLAAARTAARTGSGIAPMNGAPSSVLYSRNSKTPVELFATRDNKTTGYAVLNPVNGYWVVFTINDVTTGNFTAMTVESSEDAFAALKKVGTISKSRDRASRVEIDPNNLHQIPDQSNLTGWAKFIRNTQMKGQNTFLPIFEVARFLDKMGIKSNTIQDLVMYESRLGHFVNDFERRIANPVQRALREAGKQGATVEDMDLFLMSRHAKERNEAINSINPTNKMGSGLSTKEAQENLDYFAKQPYAEHFNEIGKLMDQLSKDKINYMLSTDLINKYQFATLNKYDHYVNLSGNKELKLDEYDVSSLGGKAFNLKGRELIRSTGRGTKAVDVLQNTMNAYLATVIRGQKNRAMQSILNMLEQNPDPTYVTIEPIKERKQVNVERLNFDKKILRYIGDADNEGSGRQLLKNLQAEVESGSMDADDALQEITRRINEAEMRRDITSTEATQAIKNLSESVVMSARLSPDGYVTMVEDNSLMNDPMVIVAKVNGKPVVMRFTERGREFVDAVSGTKIDSGGGIIEGFGKWNRFFSQLVTSWNPAWVPINFLRDIQTAFANASSDPRVGVKLANEMRKQWIPAMRAAFNYTRMEHAELKGKKSGAKISDDWYGLIRQFEQDGGGTFFLDRKGLEQSLDKLQRHMSGPKGVLQHTEQIFEGVGNVMELLSNPTEMAPRLAAYKVLLEQGWSREDAAQYAKELTVNFNMKGSSKAFRSLYVFANPAIQGTARLFQDYSRSETGIGKYLPSNRFAMVSAAWMALGMLTSFIARAVGGEDEERKGVDKIDTIPAFKRATSLVLLPNVVGGAIPVAYGWNVFSTAGQYALDVMTGKIKPEVAATRVASAALESFLPVGAGAESKSASGTFFKTVLPSPLVPIYEISTNENRFGAPITKGNNEFSTIKEAESYSAFDSVNPITKYVMQALAKIGAEGNPRYKPGILDFNPGNVDYLISNYLPGLITEAYKGAGRLVDSMIGRDRPDAPIPVVDRFKAKTPEGFDTGAVRRVSEQVNNLYKEAMAPDTSGARRDEILAKHPGLGAMQAIITSTNQQMKSISQNLEAIERNPTVPDKEKIQFRNDMDKLKKQYTANVMKTAVQYGFKDEVIDNKSGGIAGKVFERIRN